MIDILYEHPAWFARLFEGLEARANVEISRKRMRLDHINARSGNLRLRGHVSKQQEQPTGAFLLSSGPLNVGVKLSDGATSVSPFVGDDWLRE